MATVAAPYGLRAINHIGGTPYAGSTRLLPITTATPAVTNATPIYYGQVVGLATAANSGTVVVVPTLGSGAAGAGTQFPSGVLGVFVGCTYSDPVTGVQQFNQFWPGNASTDAIAYIVDDPEVCFQVQASAAVAQTQLGRNAHLTQVQTAALGAGGGNPATGNSLTTINAATVAVTASFPFRIVDFVDSPTSTVGDAFTDCIVKFNGIYHSYNNPTGI